MQEPESHDSRARAPRVTQTASALAIDMHEYQRGDEILYEGQEIPFFLVILSGRVRISRGGRKLRTLGDQDIFGLESLILKSPSYYTAIALERSRIARYGEEALDVIIRQRPRMVQSLLKSTLEQLAQSTHLMVDHAPSLDEATMKFFRDGEAIMDPNTSDTEFYRLVSTQGRLQVRMNGNQIAVIDKPGEFFGRMAGMLEIPAGASVVSIGESVIEIYNVEDLELLIRDYPDAARRMLRSMILRLAKMSREKASGSAHDSGD